VDENVDGGAVLRTGVEVEAGVVLGAGADLGAGAAFFLDLRDLELDRAFG
ncbi:unnamed protein product, partial [uncultured virus]